MTDLSENVSSQQSTGRLILFVLYSPRHELDGSTRFQLQQLRPFADKIRVIASAQTLENSGTELAELVDETVAFSGFLGDARAYRAGLGADPASLHSFTEVLFTGNGWFGPVGSPAKAFQQALGSEADLWQLLENRDSKPEVFLEEGFPAPVAPWTWLRVTASAFNAPAWQEYWRVERKASETEFAAFFQEAGFSTEVGYRIPHAPRSNPGLFSPLELVDAGCPVVLRALFGQYPPLLDRFAVQPRLVVERMVQLGYPVEHLWSALVKSTPPAALNAMMGMLEVLPDGEAGSKLEPTRATDELDQNLRIAFVVHVPQLGFMEQLLGHLAFASQPFDLVITTTDGSKAAKIRKRLRNSSLANLQKTDIRVAWVPQGRDMGAFLVGCRDLVHSGRYDLIVRLHGREPRRKPINVRDYFQRYQIENILSSPLAFETIVQRFKEQPQLGMMFPPMLHIGYATMGRGWGAYRKPAEQISAGLGIEVPLDEVSPLAPYGGMWVGRPEALKVMFRRRWVASDYRRSNRRKYVELTRVQERLLVAAAAEGGYYSQTILNREHAEVAFTALEYKADEMFSTTRGYPVEQIHLLRRAGWLGYGGPVALVRVYLNLTLPIVAAGLQPIYRGARNTALLIKRIRRSISRDALRGDDGSTP